jgi:hypothetical protein
MLPFLGAIAQDRRCATTAHDTSSPERRTELNYKVLREHGIRSMMRMRAISCLRFPLEQRDRLAHALLGWVARD